jgi:hypothetical protein
VILIGVVIIIIIITIIIINTITIIIIIIIITVTITIITVQKENPLLKPAVILIGVEKNNTDGLPLKKVSLIVKKTG